MTFTLNSTFNSQTPPRFPSPQIRRTRRRKRRDAHKRAAFRASASANGDGFANFSWEKVSRSLFRLELVPEFVQWNKLDNWKDIEKWEPKRVGALILYIIIVTISYQRVYVAITTHIDRQGRKELTEAYMEALIPEPSPANIRRFKKGLWRKTMPKGLKIKKFIKSPGGALIQDNSYIGEDAWDDDPEPSQHAITNIIDKDTKLSDEQKKELKENLRISGLVGKSVESQVNGSTWQERLHTWKIFLRRDKIAEQIDSTHAKYVVDFDMQEVERSLRKDVVEKGSDTQGSRALWIAKRWWYYRPKLPYTYFLSKLDCSEEVQEKMKQMFPVMFDDFVKPFQINLDEEGPLPVNDRLRYQSLDVYPPPLHRC